MEGDCGANVSTVSAATHSRTGSEYAGSVYPPPMANHHLGRRDVLTLAGLASLSSLGPPLAGQTMTTPNKQSVEARRRELYALLGDLPDRRRPIGGKKRGEEERDGYILETWDLDLNGIETVPAYLARPRGLTGRAPAVVFDHSHGGGYTIGKKEFTDGRSYLQPVPYAKVLTDLGYVGLAIDHWVFGERSHTTELDMFKAMLWKGQVLWGMMVYDSLRALDWLVTRPDVDSARIGTLGMSMGSTMAWWLAALDERVKVTVDICCLTDFDTLLAKKGLERPRRLLLRARPAQALHDRRRSTRSSRRAPISASPVSRTS